MRISHLLLTATLVAGSSGAMADCFDDAAAYHQVNAWTLRAIAYQESSFNERAVGRNSNGSVDVGLTQTNSIHFPDLAKFGISARDLFDPCKSTFVAAWLLRKKILKHGNTWAAVGAYHSETPSLRDRYAAQVKRTVDFWIRQGIAVQ